MALTAKKILILVGHSDSKGFCTALADAYEKGATDSRQAEVKRLNLYDLKFDPILHRGYNEIQPLEEDLVRAQELFRWANHIVIVYPVWWGSVPAILKGFLDRTLLPGFGFKYHQNDPFWDKLLTGRTARLIVTSHAPGWYNWIVGRDSAINMIRKTTLEFCGIKPVKVTRFGGIRGSTPETRAKWLSITEVLGHSLA